MKFEEQVKLIKAQIADGYAIKIQSNSGVWILDENPTEAEIEVFFAQLKILKKADTTYTVSTGKRKETSEPCEECENEEPSEEDVVKARLEATRALMSLMGIDLEADAEDFDDDEEEELKDNRAAKEIALDLITEDLKNNNYKLSPATVATILEMSAISYARLTPSMRTCVIQLPTGHEVIGVAQVLNPENDVEAIGNEVAYKNAVEEAWKAIGGVAKAIMRD